MKNQHQNLQRQISDLIPIVEHCLPLIKEVDKTQEKLKLLPVELEQLQKHVDLLNPKPSLEKLNNSAKYNLQPPIETAEYKLDYIVDDLEEIFIYLTNLDRKFKNVLALKERLEAVQEERIDGITSERIYKLLEKKQQLKNKDNNSSTNTNHLQRGWQKFINYKYSKKTAVATVVIAVIIFSFGAISYSSIKCLSIESNPTRKSKQINKIIN